MRIQLKVAEVILILMMNENHLVVFLHCLAFNPRRLVLQAKFEGRLDNRFIDHLNRKFLRSSRLPQVLAGRYNTNVFANTLAKVSQISDQDSPRLPIVWLTIRILVKTIVRSWN